MQIKQITDGRPETLEEFYTEILSEGPQWETYARKMLALIRHLKEEVDAPASGHIHHTII